MHATPSQRVGAAIQERMTASDTTQLSLSALTGISQTALSRKLSGQKDFTVPELFRVAAALKAAPEDFIRAAVAA